MDFALDFFFVLLLLGYLEALNLPVLYVKIGVQILGRTRITLDQTFFESFRSRKLNSGGLIKSRAR